MPRSKTKAKRPKPPDHLADEGLLEWERICDELESRGSLDSTDRALITTYCEIWATWREATANLRKHGSVILYDNNVAAQSPFYKVAKETAAMLRGFLADMGLNPTARAKTKAPGDEEDDDEDFV